MNTGLVDSIGKLSIEVVAILTLAYMVWIQGKGHEKMSHSIDKLTHELSKRNEENLTVKRTVEKIHRTVKDDHSWSRLAVGKLARKA